MLKVKASMEINVKTSMEINVKILEITFLPSPRTLHSVVQLGGGQSGYTPLNIFRPLSPLTEPNFQQLKNSVFSALNIQKKAFQSY